jgi:hypothetical protein
LEIDEGFEMGVADWPLGRWEAVLVVVYGEVAIYRPLGICAFAENEEDFLMYP